MPGKLLTSLRNTIPTVSSTTGPEFAQNVNDVLTGILDDLEPAVKASEINIDADFDVNTQSLLDVLTMQLNNQASTLSGASNANRVYVANGNLRFVNGSGMDVGITSGSALDSTSLKGFTNDYGLAQEAARYTASGSLYEFLSDTSPSDLHANVATGAVRVHETGVASSNRVTLMAPAGLAGNYNWQFPASAAIAGISATADLRINSSGVLTVNETDTFPDQKHVVSVGSAIQATTNMVQEVTTFIRGDGVATTQSGGLWEVHYPLDVRVGSRFTDVQVNVQQNSTARTVTVRLQKQAKGVGTPTTIDSNSSAAVGIIQLIVATPETVVTDTQYWIEVEVTSPNGGSINFDYVSYTIDKV